MRKVLFSPEAIEDLENIWVYIAQNSPTQADCFLDKLETLCKEDLSLFPQIGSGRDYLSPGVLALPFRNYMIYYRCIEERVEIVRVLHGSRDMGGIF
jgi:toxin ParE1/3/4